MILKGERKLSEENAFELKEKKPGLKFNLRLAIVGLRTTGPWGEGRERLVSPPPLHHPNKWNEENMSLYASKIYFGR